jgi:hemolysin-activating ACP:hemolysin acyltransferase
MNVYSLAKMASRLGVSVDAPAHNALALGLAARFFSGHQSTIQFGLRLQPMWRALETNNYEFYFDAIGRPVGFVSWALVDEHGDAALLAERSDNALLPSHGVGDHLWIMDFFAVNQSLRAILGDLCERFRTRHDKVKYFRVRGNKRVVKQFKYNEHSALFRNATTGGSDDSQDLTRNELILHTYRLYAQELIMLGERLCALRRCDPLLRSPLWSHSFILANWISLRQVRLYRDANGAPAGLLTWAWLSDHTASALRSMPLHATHMSEWNEGRTLCFCDVLVSEAVREQIMDDVCSGLFPDQDTVLLYTGPLEEHAASVQRISRSTDAAAISRWFSTVSIEGI